MAQIRSPSTARCGRRVSNLACCSSTSSANNCDSPARISAAIRASAAPARCSSTAAAPSPAPSSRCRPTARRSRQSKGSRRTANCIRCRRLLGGARPPVRLLHAGDDHGGGDAARRTTPPVRARNSRGHLRQFLPLHRLSAHRQRDSERRKEGVSSWPTSPVSAEARRPARQAARGSAPDSRPRHLCRRRRAVGMQHIAFKRSDVAHGRIVSHRHDARPRPWKASKPCSPARKSPSCCRPCRSARRSLRRNIAPSRSIPSLRRRACRRGGRERSVCCARRGRGDRRDLRHAAGRRRPRNSR